MKRYPPNYYDNPLYLKPRTNYKDFAVIAALVIGIFITDALCDSFAKYIIGDDHVQSSILQAGRHGNLADAANTGNEYSPESTNQNRH